MTTMAEMTRLGRTATARLMLKNRATRLLRLLALNAPDVIVANEAMLVAKAAPLLGFEAMKSVFDSQCRLAIRLAGFCDVDGCEERADPASVHEQCAKHHAETVHQLAEDTAEDAREETRS